MTQQPSNLQLFKIVVGVAWIDGKIQTEEQDYLRRLANSQGIADHPEINPLLNGLKKVSKEQCTQWISDYLGNNPDPEKLNHLLEEISGLVYSDGNIDSAEATLLNEVQGMMAPTTPCKALNSRIVQKIQTYYKQLSALGT